MAGAGAKKRAEDNRRTIRNVGAYAAACTVLFAVVRLWLKATSLTWAHWVGFAATLASHGLAYASIVAVARPVYEHGMLIDGGGDLGKGLISYYFDLLYVTGAVQVCAALSDWGWWLALVVPAFGGYVVATKLAGLWAASKKAQVPAELDEATLRRLERTQQRAERRARKRF